MSDPTPLFPRRLQKIPLVRGDGRGKTLTVPTINLDPRAEGFHGLETGVYACWITLGATRYMGAMHYGPRPSFDATPSAEVHVIDANIEEPPHTAGLEIVERIRDIRRFASSDDLRKQIHEDISKIRAILHHA